MSIWLKASSLRVSKALKAHSVLALALGGLIYILALTGTLSVFNHELQRWEQPGAPEMSSIAPEAAAMAARFVFESEDVPTTHLYINFPQPDLPRTVITTDTQAFFANQDGTIAGEEDFPFTQFLLDLHYYLHMPHILGLTIVGALGAFLIAMSISGFLAHPRIFRDAFTLRRGRDRVPLTDLHNRLSVWTAPFHISNALTGAILGLASILAFVIASVEFDGDTGKVFDPVFGGEPEAIEGPANLANIAGPLKYMHDTFPHRPPTYFILHDPSTIGQHSTIIAEHSERLIFGEYYNFAADGVYEGKTGISDGTIGQQIIGSVYNVHFGNWGGVFVKFAYFVFGVSLCTIIASGIRIYFLRRREKGRAAPRMEAGWEGIVWGVPAVLALTLLVTVADILSGVGLVCLFWFGLVAVLLGSITCASASKIGRFFQVVTALGLCLSLALHGYIHSANLLSAATLQVSVSVMAVCTVLLAAAKHQPAKPMSDVKSVKMG